MGRGGEDDGLLNGAARAAVVGGTRWVKKERKRQRGGSLRTSSATGVRMVEMTDVLGLGFIPN
jgi:hypothetical protein